MPRFLLFAPLWALAAASWAADAVPPVAAPAIVPGYRADTEPRPLDWRAANARVAPEPAAGGDEPAGHSGHDH